MFVVLKGALTTTRRDGLGHVVRAPQTGTIHRAVFGDRQSRGLARVSTITMFIGTWNPSLSMCSVSTVEKRASTNALIALWEILNDISSRFVLRAREVSPG
jgi:hypothetical protein